MMHECRGAGLQRLPGRVGVLSEGLGLTGRRHYVKLAAFRDNLAVKRV